MENVNLLPLLKLNLQITSNAYDTLLTHDLGAAEKMIVREGITLTDSVDDSHLIVMYASYLFEKRNTGEPMPRMLRYALNNRLFAEKGGTDV